MFNGKDKVAHFPDLIAESSGVGLVVIHMCLSPMAIDSLMNCLPLLLALDNTHTVYIDTKPYPQVVLSSLVLLLTFRRYGPRTI